MLTNGHIKLSRKLLVSDDVSTAEEVAVLVRVLLQTNWRDSDFGRRGIAVVSPKIEAQRLGMTRKKYNTVIRALRDRKCIAEEPKPNRSKRQFVVTNWDVYQAPADTANQSRTAGEPKSDIHGSDTSITEEVKKESTAPDTSQSSANSPASGSAPELDLDAKSNSPATALANELRAGLLAADPDALGWTGAASRDTLKALTKSLEQLHAYGPIGSGAGTPIDWERQQRAVRWLCSSDHDGFWWSALSKPAGFRRHFATIDSAARRSRSTNTRSLRPDGEI